MEKKLKTKISKILKGNFYYNTRDAHRAGVPDMYVAAKKALWIELKYTESHKLKHKLSPQQSEFLSEINKAGGCGYMLVGLPDNKCVIEKVFEICSITEIDLSKSMDLNEALDLILKEANA